MGKEMEASRGIAGYWKVGYDVGRFRYRRELVKNG